MSPSSSLPSDNTYLTSSPHPTPPNTQQPASKDTKNTAGTPSSIDNYATHQPPPSRVTGPRRRLSSSAQRSPFPPLPDQSTSHTSSVSMTPQLPTASLPATTSPFLPLTNPPPTPPMFELDLHDLHPSDLMSPTTQEELASGDTFPSSSLLDVQRDLSGRPRAGSTSRVERGRGGGRPASRSISNFGTPPLPRRVTGMGTPTDTGSPKLGPRQPSYGSPSNVLGPPKIGMGRPGGSGGGLVRRISTPNMRKEGLPPPPPPHLLFPALASPGSRSPNQVLPTIEPDTPPKEDLPAFLPSSYPSSSGSLHIPLPTPTLGKSDLGEILENPSTAAAAGGVLTGVWMVGKAVAGALRTPQYERVPSSAKGKGKERDMGGLGITQEEEGERGGEGEAWEWGSHGESVETKSSNEGYFDLAPTNYNVKEGTLPTPALSGVSLSGFGGKGRNRSSSKAAEGPMSAIYNLKDYLFSSVGKTSPPLPGERYQANPRKEGFSPEIGPVEELEEVELGVALRDLVKEMGWVLGLMGVAFVVSLGIVAVGLMSMPITSLKALPKKVSDLQILSAEIRGYMASGSTGWWHTIIVLIVTGCWKHSWSVPGAVVLNILVGSILKPMQAFLLLTIITSFGSLGAYTLSRPLGPIIALIFPKPLALVRSALKGDDDPPSSSIHLQSLSTDGARISVGDSPERKDPTVWRRLLVMRAMGLVPWSGMNVACGVVGVRWTTFLFTTAAGSASWSYVTASIGDILSRLAMPGSAASATSVGDGSEVISGGESLTTLLRDPYLILKLVLLSGLSLLPVLFKSRSNPELAPPPPSTPSGGRRSAPLLSLESQSKTPLAPTPSVYHILAVLSSVSKKAVHLVVKSWREMFLSAGGGGAGGRQGVPGLGQPPREMYHQIQTEVL